MAYTYVVADRYCHSNTAALKSKRRIKNKKKKEGCAAILYGIQ